MNQYNFAFYIGIALWAIETVVFGFHPTAQSGLERVFDGISLALIIFGAIGLWVTTIKTVITVHGNITMHKD